MHPRKKAGSKVTQSAEDYLERIHELVERQGFASVSEIAETLNLTRSTVSNMVRRLASQGLLNHQRYRGFSLTAQGRAVARGIQSRHQILTEFLELLGLESDDVREDVEGIEHHVSLATLKALEALTRALRKHPPTLKLVLDRTRGGKGRRTAVPLF